MLLIGQSQLKYIGVIYLNSFNTRTDNSLYYVCINILYINNYNQDENKMEIYKYICQ